MRINSEETDFILDFYVHFLVNLFFVIFCIDVRG